MISLCDVFLSHSFRAVVLCCVLVHCVVLKKVLKPVTSNSFFFMVVDSDCSKGCGWCLLAGAVAGWLAGLAGSFFLGRGFGSDLDLDLGFEFDL